MNKLHMKFYYQYALLKFGVTNDSMRALEELNGELNGLVFNGKII